MSDHDEIRARLAGHLNGLTPPPPPGAPPTDEPDPLEGLTHCPTCGSCIAGYDKRSLTKAMGKALIRQLNVAGTNWVHTPNIWAPCKYGYEWEWRGLIEAHPTDRGVWRANADAVAYRHDRLWLPKYARTRFDTRTGHQTLAELWGPPVRMSDLVPFSEQELLNSMTPHLPPDGG